MLSLGVTVVHEITPENCTSLTSNTNTGCNLPPLAAQAASRIQDAQTRNLDRASGIAQVELVYHH